MPKATNNQPNADGSSTRSLLNSGAFSGARHFRNGEVPG
jgi:hypothetical protein